MTQDVTGIAVCSGSRLTSRITNAAIYGLAVLLLWTLASPTASAQGLTARNCIVNGTTIQAYLCLDDIVVVDGSGYNGSGYPSGFKVGGLYLVNPTNGNQTPISTGGRLGQAASLTLEPGTGKILASSRQYGVIRVDPKDGSQEVILKGGTGWGKPFPTFSDSANSNATESFIYPGGITIDPVDSSILVTDTGINLFDKKLNGDPNCTDPNNVRTCESLPGKIIRINKGQGAGVYTGTYAVVAKGGDPLNNKFLSNPFDIVADGGSSLYVTDMSAQLGGASDPGKGGIIYLDATKNYLQSSFFSSYANNPTTTPYGCPMGITISAAGTVYATVFTYNGFGCAPQAVFSLTPGPGTNPPTVTTVVNGYPLQYPFGMDPDRNNGIIIADEGSGYSCSGTIFRFDLTKPYQPDAHQPNPNPFALSPYFGLGCTPPNQTYLATPSDAAVVKVVVSANIAVPPSTTITGAPGSSPEGTAISLNSSVTPSGTYTYSWTVTKTRNGTTTSYTTGSAANLTFTPDDDGTYAVTLSVTGAGGTGSDSKTINVFNVAPAVGIMGIPVNSSEGTSITLTSTVSDPSPVDTAAGFLYSWTVLKNGSPFASGSTPSLTFTPDHGGSYAVTLNATDKDGGTGTSTTTISVANVPPVITSVTGPVTPKILGSSATITANFKDAGTADTHTCGFTWGDGATGAGSVTETNGSGSCTQTHVYADDGVYTVTVTVTDDGGLVATSKFQFVVIYDPTEATLSGSGTFVSPAGADAYDPSLTDTATFGFSVMYTNGAIDPASYKLFSFDLGNLWFTSSTIDWFVTSGPNAQFHGTGTVNSDGRAWTFLATVTDGQQPGGGGVDKYRFKLIDDTGLVVYDNVRGAPDDINLANPQPIASGRITLFFNTPPTVTSLSLDSNPINEGGTVTLTGTFSDPDAGQKHTVTVNWADGTAGTTVSVSATSSNFAASHKYKDNPNGTPAYTIGVSVADSMGAVGTGSTSVTVNNVPPVITSVTGPTTTVATGAAATVKVSFTDVGVLDTHTCAYAWGDGQTSSGSVTESNGSGSCTASHIYTAGGAQTVTIAVTDKDGGSVSSTFSLLVNTPPAVSSLSLSATTINEGGQTTLTGTFTDADTADTHTVTINWGDGTGNTGISLAAGTLNFSSTHKYKDNPAGTPSGGSFTIGVTVADNHSGKGTGSTSIIVNNVAPVIGTITKPSPAVLLGSAANLKVNFSDVGTLDTHTCTFAFGDGQTSSGSVTETNGSGSCSTSYTYGAAGTYTVMVTVTDKDSASVSSSFQVVVDTPPAISTLSLSAATINEGDQPTLSGTFTDPDTSDTHKITINWGDGASNTSISLAAGVFTFSAAHRYLDNPAGIPAGGTFTINVTVADNFVGSATGGTSVTVNNVAPVLNVPPNAVYGNSPGLTQDAWTPFTDKGTLDTHTCTYNWGDGNTDTFPAGSDTNGSGLCSIPHTYASSGTYMLTITVVDKDGGSTGPKTFPMVVPGP